MAKPQEEESTGTVFDFVTFCYKYYKIHTYIFFPLRKVPS